MSEMIDRVARAIWDHREGWLAEVARTTFEDCDQAKMFEIARAAIAAMREPTEVMAKSGCEDTIRIGPHGAKEIWRAMVDGALK